MKGIIVSCIVIYIFFSCDEIFKSHNTGVFPDTPVNFEEINTEFDDYNSTAPTFGETFPLCFSSTRDSKGENFDIIYKGISKNYKSDLIFL